MTNLSIIIPMYKVEAFIERCLNSCVHQDLQINEYEIICVNDGSPDRSAEIARSIAEQHKNIKVVDRENGGLSAARNTGLRNAQGKYVFFVDSDDWIKENCLSEIYRRCENQNLDMLRICAANMIDDKPIRRFSYANEDTVKEGRSLLREGIQFCAPFSIYRRGFLKDNNLWFYEGIYHEDNEFTPRAFYKAERVGAYNELLYFVYQNPNSITRSFNPKKAFDCITVINSLHNFQLKEDPGIRNSFNYVIAGTLNAALFEAVELSKEQQKDFSDALYKIKEIYSHLVYSGQTRYEIEGVLLKLFPKFPITIYRLMNIFDMRKIKRSR